MIKKALGIFKPAPHIARLPQEKIEAAYSKKRLQVFSGIFVGYASFYLLRNNFALAIPFLLQQGSGFTKASLGFVFAALPLAYGLSKFIMGAVSDRSNPRYFMATGLIISAIISFFLGTNGVLASLPLMAILLFINGWCQGMGWPASARVMVHWFTKKERGTKASAWTTAANLGGALLGPVTILGAVLFSSWHSIFYFPAIISLFAAVFVLWTVRDTPQSEGLPPIEEHRKDHYTDSFEEQEESASREKELTFKEIFFKYIFVNKYLWYLALANVFIYIVRYGVINWVPTYLTEAKGFAVNSSRWAYFVFEFAAIPGVILCGWISDKFFKARRAPAAMLFMFAVIAGVFAYWFIPVGYQFYDYMALIMLGFFAYGPIAMIYVTAMDVVPKKAAGTAAGLVGLFGYVGGAVIANAGMGAAVDRFGWDGGFVLLLVSCVCTMTFFLLTWNAKLIGKKEVEGENLQAIPATSEEG